MVLIVQQAGFFGRINMWGKRQPAIHFPAIRVVSAWEEYNPEAERMTCYNMSS